jgi:uncharacterized protein YfaS (alpha-2-macroglobulin family)
MNLPALRRLSLPLFALALLMLNAAGWVWVRHARLCAPEPECAAEAADVEDDSTAAPATAAVPLVLERLAQATLSTNRLLTLACQFQAAVEWATLGARLTLHDGEAAVPWQFVDSPQGNACQIQTLAPVRGDRLRAVLEPGVRSTDTRYTPTAARTDTLLPVTPVFRFSEAGSVTPSFGQPEIYLEFTQDVDLQLAAGCIACEPPAAFTVVPRQHWWRGGLTLRGEFAVGQTYTVVVAPRLRSAEGHALEHEVRRAVFIRPRAPATEIAVPGRYLAPEGALIVPVLAVNTPVIVSSLAPVLPQNLVQFAMREAEQYANWYAYGEGREGDAAGDLTGPAILRTNRLAAVRDREQRLALRLRDHLPPEGAKGVFLLRLEAEKAATRQRLVCLSDIGLAARREPEALQVWTTALRAGRAASGCEVSLYGRNNALLDTVVTDQAGLGRLGFDPARDQPFLLVAQNPADGDMTFLPLTDATEVESPEAAARGYLAPAACEAYLFTERDLYRHGEKAFVQALLRQADGRAPAPFPAVLRILKPDGRRFTTLPVMADARGAATTEVTFPDYLPSGTYTLELALPGEQGARLGQHAVMLEAFVPPQIRVSLRDLPATLRCGDTLAGTLAAEHLFGKPAAGLAAEAQLLWQALPMAPGGWDDYAFGDPERRSAPATLHTPRQRLDGEGRAALALALPSALRPAARLRGIVQGTVFEAGGRGVTARGEVTVDAYPFYLGVRRPAAAIAQPGSPLAFRVAAVNPDGTRLDRAVAVTAVVEQVSWINNLRREPSGHYEWSSETIRTPVGGGPLLLPAAEDGVFTLAAPNDGDYEITFAEPTSAAATRCAFTTGSGEPVGTPRDRSRPGHVDLVFDKPVYQPGDLARVQIRAPFAGEAWITLQRDQIIESRVITLKANTAEATFPVTAALAPNAEVAVSVIRPATAETVWSAHRATGLGPLRVQPPERKLSVSVTPPAAVCRPCETLPVRIQATDAAGAGAAEADVTLLAVDEGICMLTDFQTPDPLAYFQAVRAGNLPFHDIYRQLMPVTGATLNGEASHTAGDAAADLLKRLNPVAARRFKPLALWRTRVALDATGGAEIPLTLPEFAGELRLMAIAWTAGATGSGAATVKIRRRLIVQPDVSRVLAPLDRAVLTLALHNESGEICDATVHVATQGPLACRVGRQGLELAAGESRTLLLPIEAAEAIGTARIEIAVEGVGERYHETLELAVRPAQAWQVTTEYARLAPGAVQTFPPPAGLLAGSLRQVFTCAPRPTVNLLGALEHVTEYPFGCLEQTVSSVFPLLTLGRQAEPVVPPASTLAHEAPDRIRAALTRVLTMQRHDGFAPWPEVRDSDPFCSLYAAHFLVEAKADGLPVSGQTLTELHALMENLPSALEPTQQAYAAMVQSLAGKPDFARMSRLLEQAAQLPPEARFLLGRALLRAGERETGRRLVEETGIPGGLREAAFGTLAWLEIDPAAAQTAACCQAIQRRRRAVGHWGTTQDNALALLALGEYARHAAAAPQEVAPRFTWDGGAFAAGPTNLVAWRVPAPAARQPLVLTNAGPGTLYVSRRIEAVPLAERLPDVDAGLRVRRRWLTPEGQPIGTERLNRGDLIIVEIALATPDETAAPDTVIEDLLPACLEIEHGEVARGGMFDWLKADEADWVLHREVRDDRLLLFTRETGQRVCHYAARVVTAGEFTVPPIVASDMYVPERISRHGGGRVVVATP